MDGEAVPAEERAVRPPGDTGRGTLGDLPAAALAPEYLGPPEPGWEDAAAGESFRRFSNASSFPLHARYEHRDSVSWLNAVKASELELELESEPQKPQGSGLPVLLIGFVCVLALVAGFVVVGVHYAVIYSGCPLGINGCNEFHDKEDKGFFLLRALDRAFDGHLPHEVVYVAAAVLGSFAVGQLQAWLPEHLAFQLRGGGTIQSLVAVATGERILPEAALLRVLVSCLYLGSGGSLGMEGPAIQVCTSMATLLGWLMGIRAAATQSLLASLGFACGFAASFNAPLSGILFSMEELQHVSPRLSQAMICIILVASVVSTATVRACQGNSTIFDLNWGPEGLDSALGDSLGEAFGLYVWMLIAVPIGGLCAVVALLVVRSMRWLHRRLAEARLLGLLPLSAAFALQGLVASGIGACVFRATGLRGVWGVGAESLQQAFSHEFRALQYLAFAAGKVAAMVLGISVRAPGDVLEPVLISGGFLGGTVGRVLVACSGLDTAVVKPCVIFGMVGLFASCFRFPLTPVVIVLEITGIQSYMLVLPTVLTSFVAITISNRFCQPVLDEMMHEDGIDLHALGALSEDRGFRCDAAGTAKEEDLAGAWVAQAADFNRRSSHNSSQNSSFSLVFSRIEDSLLERSTAPAPGVSSATTRNTPRSYQGSRQGSRKGSDASFAQPSEAELRPRRPSVSSVGTQGSSRSKDSAGRAAAPPPPPPLPRALAVHPSCDGGGGNYFEGGLSA